jgi:hypothetical protein
MFNWRKSISLLIPICVLTTIFILYSTESRAQKSAEYQKKVLTYINAVACRNSVVKVTSKQTPIFIDEVNQALSLVRFECFPLSPIVSIAIQEELDRQSPLDQEQISSLVSDKAGPVLFGLLDDKKEIMAGNMADEAQRASFIALKAKEMDISADQLEKVLNSAFIYLPFIDSISIRSSKDSKDAWQSQAFIRGGIFLFHLNSNSSEYSVDLDTIITGESSNSLTDIVNTFGININRTRQGGQEESEESAFRNASKSFAKDISFQLKGIPEFNLGKMISETSAGNVYFQFGRKEGVSVDDRYSIFEQEQDSLGNIRNKDLGFVRVVKVGNNNNDPLALTKARVVSGGGYQAGMLAKERPFTSFDVFISASSVPVQLKPGKIERNGQLYSEISSSGHATSFFGRLGAQYDLGSQISFTQTYLTAEINFGVVSFDQVKTYTGTNLAPPMRIGLLYGGQAGLMKKFYFGPLALKGQAQGAYLKISNSVSDSVTHADYELHSYGLTADMAMELALSISSNLGFGVSYFSFKPADLNLKDKDKTIQSDITPVPKMQFNGIGFNLYLVHSF